METSSKTFAAIDNEQATLFVALELSQATWLVALHSPIADKISLHRIDGGDTGKLLALIEKKRDQAARQLGRMVRIVSCYEAGRDGFWLHRLLIRRGIDNRVLDSASILVDRRARRAKTDRLDARALVRVLMALLRGEEQVCRVVRVPSIAQEDERRLSRERERLLHERNSHIARIKGLLALHGVRDFRLIERDWKERLDAIRMADGRALPARAKTEIDRECRRLWLAKNMLVEVEREIEQMIAHDSTTAGKLIRVRGIGPTFASVLTHEVFYRSFDNRRQVGSYLGLVSIPWQSGSVRRDQGITRSGNARARRCAIELAWLWLRHQPGSALACWYRTRVGTMTGRMRRITLVALARKLIVALWRYLQSGIVPEGAELKAA
jgi:transposase